MQEQTRFVINASKCLIALATFLCLTVISICLLTIREYAAAAIFFAVGLLFLPAAWVYGGTVTVDDEGIRTSRFGHTGTALKWGEVAEVGVAGSLIFCRRNQKTGTLYLYVSPVRMTEDERFDMMLRFPPKDKIYLIYSKKAFTAIQLRWDNTIQAWNTCEFRFDRK